MFTAFLFHWFRCRARPAVAVGRGRLSPPKRAGKKKLFVQPMGKKQRKHLGHVQSENGCTVLQRLVGASEVLPNQQRRVYKPGRIKKAAPRCRTSNACITQQGVQSSTVFSDSQYCFDLLCNQESETKAHQMCCYNVIHGEALLFYSIFVDILSNCQH